MIYLLFFVFTLLVLLIVWYQWQYFAIFTPTYIKNRQECPLCKTLVFKMQDGAKLEGVVYEPQNATKTLLFFGGRSHDSVALITRLATLFPNVRIVTCNYRSYGKSEGVISEKNILEDALHVTRITRERFGDALYLMGFSLGSSLAAYSASKIEVTGVFLIGAFDSISSLFYTKRKIKVPDLLVRYKFPTKDFLLHVTPPLYIFASKDDLVTPIQNTRNLKQNAQNLQGYYEFEQLNHKELLWDSRVAEVIQGVLNDR